MTKGIRLHIFLFLSWSFRPDDPPVQRLWLIFTFVRHHIFPAGSCTIGPYTITLSESSFLRAIFIYFEKNDSSHIWEYYWMNFDFVLIFISLSCLFTQKQFGENGVDLKSVECDSICEMHSWTYRYLYSKTLHRDSCHRRATLVPLSATYPPPWRCFFPVWETLYMLALETPSLTAHKSLTPSERWLHSTNSVPHENLCSLFTQMYSI